METIYNVDYFIKKFKAIPRKLFTTFSQGGLDTVGNIPHCAAGWCKSDCGSFGRSTVHSPSSVGFLFSSELVALVELFRESGITFDIHGNGVADINNGTDKRYQQPTPKQRILAALYDIKKAQQPEVKEKIVYVTVDEPVRELQKKELSVN